MSEADAPTLADRLVAARLELDALERASGAAVLDGRTVDPLAISAARANVEALEAAELEDTRRQRAVGEAQRAIERAEARRALGEALGGYVDAIERAEIAGKAMVEAFRDADQQAGRMRGYYRAIERVPFGTLDERSMADVHSRMLATTLKTLTGQARFGVMRWNSCLAVPHWADHTRKTIVVAVQPVTEGN